MWPIQEDSIIGTVHFMGPWEFIAIDGIYIVHIDLCCNYDVLS